MSEGTAHDQQTKRKKWRRHAMGGELRGPDLKTMVGKNTYRIRHELDVTQETMAKRLGVSASFLGGVERGQQNITLDSLSNLAAAYGVDAHALLCGAEYGSARDGGLTLDVLARYVDAANARLQDLLLRHGPIPVGRATVASLIAALFEAAGASENYQPRAKPKKPGPKAGEDTA